jgi:hypothetical protein
MHTNKHLYSTRIDTGSHGFLTFDIHYSIPGFLISGYPHPDNLISSPVSCLLSSVFCILYSIS